MYITTLSTGRQQHCMDQKEEPETSIIMMKVLPNLRYNYIEYIPAPRVLKAFRLPFC